MEISVRVSLKVCPKYWPAKNVQAFAMLASTKIIYYWHLAIDSCIFYITYTYSGEHEITCCEVHQTYSTNPRVHFLKTFSFLATERPKWLTQQIQEVTGCTLWHLMLSSSCCVPKKHPAKSLGGMEWYGKSMQGKNQVASLGSAFLISKLLHRLIAILNKRKITRAQNTGILIFLPVYAVFMSAKY